MTSTPQWPALGYESRTWSPEDASDPEAYRAPVVPLISTLTPAPDNEARTAAHNAEYRLVRFDAEMKSSSFNVGTILLAVEAIASSRIENIITPTWSVFAAAAGHRSDQPARDVAANIETIRRARRHPHDKAASAGRYPALSLHKILMRDHEQHTPGQLRQQPVWIGTGAGGLARASYVAPHHEHVSALMADLDTFVDDAWSRPIVSTAVAHAQFETIHPFTDGNGRVGRALLQSSLRRVGVSRQVTAPISSGLLADLSSYHSSLTAYRAGNIEPIITVVSEASLRAVENTRRLVEELVMIRQSWDDRLTARSHSAAWSMLEVLMQNPVLNGATATQDRSGHLTNIYPPMRALVDAGIVESKAQHRLGPFWISWEILAAIDAFVERSGRLGHG